MLRKKIVWLILVATIFNVAIPVQEVKANPVISYTDVQNASVQMGPVGPIVFFLGILALEGFEVYDALKVNNFGTIQVAKIPWLPEEGEPNTVVEKIHPNSGEVIQRRYYDEDGKAFLDIDMTDHGFPDDHPWKIQDGRTAHKHTFDWSKTGKKKRSKGSELTFYEYVKYVQLPEAFRE